MEIFDINGQLLGWWWGGVSQGDVKRKLFQRPICEPLRPIEFGDRPQEEMVATIVSLAVVSVPFKKTRDEWSKVYLVAGAELPDLFWTVPDAVRYERGMLAGA